MHTIIALQETEFDALTSRSSCVSSILGGRDAFLESFASGE